MRNWMKYAMMGLGGLSLVACSQNPQSDDLGAGEDNINKEELVFTLDQPVEIEFWHAMSGNTEEALKNVVDNFNNGVGKEKGITVTPIYQGDYDDLKSKVTAAIKADTLPAIAQAYGTHISDYLQSGKVQALDEFIFNDEVGIKDFDDIYEAYRNEVSQYDEQGTYYSLPFNKSTEVLFYNKDFFTEHNLSIPTTWDEMEELSAKIYDITKNPSLGIDSTSNYFITMVRQYGGDYTSQDGELTFAEGDAALKALELFKRNADKGYWRLAGEDKYISTPFVNEQIVMYIGSSNGASYVYNDNFEWDSAPIPQISEATKTVVQQGTDVAIFNGNNTPEQIYAAYEFAKYLCSHEGNLDWVTQTGYLPIRQSVVDSEEYKAYVTESKDTTKISGPAQADAYYYTPAFFTDKYSASQVRTEVGVAVENVILGNQEPEVALENLLNLFK